MTMLRFLAAAALVATSAPLFAADDPPPPTPRDKVAMLVVYGNDECPRSSSDEIIVCSREPESERYRIPEKLRKPKKRAADRGWTDRVRTLETVNAMGRPNSCSPVGSNGQTGCIDKFLSEWREQRKAEEVDGPQ